MKTRFLLSVLILISFSIPACSPQPQAPTPNLAETAAPTFDQFVDASFKDLLRRDPELVTVLGSYPNCLECRTTSSPR